MTNRTVQVSPQIYARLAGVLFLITIVAGGFGEWYVPSKLLVSGDAAATANNFIASDLLFRLGFAAYLVEAMCDVTLTLILYVLLRPVSNNLALLAAFFALVGTGVFAVAAMLFQFAPSFILAGGAYLKSFSPDQVNGLAMLSLKFSSYGGGLFLVFYGVASILRGVLIFKSGYLPKVLGALLALAGFGFVTLNFLFVLMPAYASDFLIPPMIVAMLALALWLLLKGVDLAKWEEKARVVRGGGS